MTAIIPIGQTASSPDFWTSDEVAEHYRTPVATLKYWRHTGYGPKGRKVGRKILYPRAEIERFDREIGLRSAADPAAPGDVPG